MKTQHNPAFLNPSLLWDERVCDLIGRMTLQEKIGLMSHESRAIPRLGIPAYNYWNEGLHGVARSGRATVFPQAIGMAATWDPNLIRRVASAIGDEARAKYHEAIRRNGSADQYQGLTIWSPNINIFRDPRWGRGQETYGEDPYLTGELGVAFVRGLQGEDPKYLKTAACAKHFAVHSGPEKDRHKFNARVSPRELNDTYLPAFKRLVQEADVEAVMGSYNQVNGIPACTNPFLLTETLRMQWGFKGHVVSDCGALTDVFTGHKHASDAVEAASQGLLAGCDLSCERLYQRLDEALERGLVTEADIDRSLARTLTTRFKLGMFDPPDLVPFASIPPSVICCSKHRHIAREAAVKSIILLKNKNNILPIRQDVKRISIVGPNAASIDVLLGNYNGYNESLSTLLEGIIGRTPEGIRVGYHIGVPLHQAAVKQSGWTTPEILASDLTIACMGYSPILESEEGDALLSAEKGDRADIGLPPAQVEFVKKLVSNGARVVLVLCGGGPIALGELEEIVDAVVFIWYSGEAGGLALADVLFGDVSPSGKLPITFPKSTRQLPAFDDYSMDARTYRYSTDEPLFPFGFGLSYTRFAYEELKILKSEIKPGKAVSFIVTLKNLGTMDAEEVVQAYLSDLEASAPVPRHRLVGFRRIKVNAGKSKVVKFSLAPDALSFVDETGERKLEAGQFCLTVGSCSPGRRGVALGSPEPLSTIFTLR